MTGPLGSSKFSPRMSIFPLLRFKGNIIHCSPRAQSLSALLLNKTKQKRILKNAQTFQRQHLATFNRTLWWRVTALNISRVTVNCFPKQQQTTPILPTPVESALDRVGVDCVGPFPLLIREIKHRISRLSHSFPKAFAVTSINGCSDNVIIPRHGPLRTLLSDRGSNFLSSLLNYYYVGYSDG